MEKNQNNAIPVGDGLLTVPLYPLEDVRLLGTRCKKCKEVMFGSNASCANCASEEVEDIPLSKSGTLWTYTIIYHCPPGSYRGPKDPFVPFAEGLVELPDGVKVLSILDCDIDKVKIGMKLELVCHELYKNEQGQSVIAWKFKAV